MRKLLVVIAGLALLVVLYGAAGYWLAPGYVREALADLALSRGIALEVRRVRTNPFTLSAVLEGVTARGPDGVSAGAERAFADLAWASLWRQGWIVQELVVESGELRYAARNLALEALTLQARGLSTLDHAAAGTYEAAARIVGGGQVASRGTLVLAAPSAEGTVTVNALRAAQFLPEVHGQVDGTARYVYADGKLALREVAAQASVPPHGKISAHGSLGIAPLRADLQLQAQAVPLALAQPWLPEQVALRIRAGSLSGEGRLRLGEKTGAYQGSAAIEGLRLEERGSGAPLLSWERAETAALKVAFSPLRLEIGELLARAPQGRLVIAQDGTVNFAAALGGDSKEKGEAVHAGIERLRIEKGTLHFADRSLANPFEVTMRDLSGIITSLGSASSEPARVRLAGRVQPYGSARIRGTIDLDAPTKLADIRADLRNLQLEAFNPYIAKFAGYRIESGRLSAALRYELREGRLVGTNRLAFEQMKLGEKLESRALVSVPLDLVVALLADSQGRIDLEIPVRGNLNDPQFELGAIVARAVGNVLRKIVSAPFRALAALFGGEDKADEAGGNVAFQPGSAALSPPAEEGVARLAKVIAERPHLGIDVRGGYDPARDLDALRLRRARDEVSRAAGVRGPPDLSDRKVVRAAEALYLKRVGDRAALEALRKSEERYGRALLQELAAALPADEGAAHALAGERAQAVRAALIDHGVDAARVRLAEPVVAQTAEQGVPTALMPVASRP